MFQPLSPDVPFADAVIAHMRIHWHGQPGIAFVPDTASAIEIWRALKKAGLRARVVALADPMAEVAQLVPGYTEPAIMPPLMRDWLIGEQLMAFFRARGQTCERGHALKLAKSLGELLDDCERYGVMRGDVLGLGGGQSQHWQEYSQFLGIVLAHWPQLEDAYGMISPALAIHRALSTVAELWEHTPPAIPVLAAGSVGTHPATARLLQAIARAPEGAVLLPGIVPVDEAYDAAIAPGHPMYHAKRLLETAGASLSSFSQQVNNDTQRAQWISHVFRPAEIDSTPIETPKQVQLIEAANEWEEVRAIAQIVCDAGQRPTMVVSADRALLRRVADELARLGIVAAPPAHCLRDSAFHRWVALLLQCVLSDARPITLLAWLQHPLTQASEDALHACDIGYARGIVKESGWHVLARVLASIPGEPWMTCLQSLFALAHARLPLAEWQSRLTEAAESLQIANTDAAFKPLQEVVLANALSLQEFAALWRALGDTPADAAETPDSHVLLATPEKSRLHKAERVILAGMNEGSWPPLRHQAWLNRAMRKQVGLPVSEHALSISAEDCALLLHTPEVFLTRAKQEGGSMTHASRFWLRIAATLSRMQSEPAARLLAQARAADQVETAIPAEPPQPNPPVALRPRALSVTQMEALIQNPYAIYAQEVLKLARLRDIEEEPDAKLFGTLAHRVLEKLQPNEAVDTLIEKILWPYQANPQVAALWHTRLQRIVNFFLEMQQQRAGRLAEFWGEQELRLTLPLSDGELHLKGKADRIERMHDGSYSFIDFKTGSENLSQKRFRAGELPQLLLYAIAWAEQQGRLPGMTEFAYWKLPQGAREGDVSALGALTPEVMQGIYARICALADQLLAHETPMLYAPHGKTKYADYEALARVGEW